MVRGGGAWRDDGGRGVPGGDDREGGRAHEPSPAKGPQRLLDAHAPLPVTGSGATTGGASVVATICTDSAKWHATGWP